MKVAASPDVRRHAIKLAYRDVKARLEQVCPGAWARLSREAKMGAVEAQLATMNIRVVGDDK
jgi:hypothetical protein